MISNLIQILISKISPRMVAKVRIPTLTCLRCGHEWVPRMVDVRLCPKCKSARWDQPKPPRKN